MGAECTLLKGDKYGSGGVPCWNGINVCVCVCVGGGGGGGSTLLDGDKYGSGDSSIDK